MAQSLFSAIICHPFAALLITTEAVVVMFGAVTPELVHSRLRPASRPARSTLVGYIGELLSGRREARVRCACDKHGSRARPRLLSAQGTLPHDPEPRPDHRPRRPHNRRPTPHGCR